MGNRLLTIYNKEIVIMIYMSRRPRKIIVLEEKKRIKKTKLSKNDKIILDSNRDLICTINREKLYAQDRKWVEARIF